MWGKPFGKGQPAPLWVIRTRGELLGAPPRTRVRNRGCGAFRAIRLATRAARKRRGDSQEENRGVSSWVELFAPLSVDMDRKWNKNYLSGFMLLLPVAAEVTKNANKGWRGRRSIKLAVRLTLSTFSIPPPL
jgi:hypothetical protein